VEALCQQEEIIRLYIYRQALLMAGYPLKDVTSGHLMEIDALCFKQSGSVCLPGNHIIYREYGYLKLGSESETELLHKDEELVLPIIAKKIFSYHVDKKIPENVCTKWIDYDKIKGDLQVRTWEQDDYIEISSSGIRKKLKRYMIDAKIPLSERHRIPLVADGHHILWIIGYRISDGCKITEDTCTVMELTILKEEMHERTCTSIIDRRRSRQKN
jgi:tRNA(Ile)-lysidine synthase